LLGLSQFCPFSSAFGRPIVLFAMVYVFAQSLIFATQACYGIQTNYTENTKFTNLDRDRQKKDVILAKPVVFC
jgi:hypothetical protein